MRPETKKYIKENIFEKFGKQWFDPRKIRTAIKMETEELQKTIDRRNEEIKKLKEEGPPIHILSGSNIKAEYKDGVVVINKIYQNVGEESVFFEEPIPDGDGNS